MAVKRWLLLCVVVHRIITWLFVTFRNLLALTQSHCHTYASIEDSRLWPSHTVTLWKSLYDNHSNSCCTLVNASETHFAMHSTALWGMCLRQQNTWHHPQNRKYTILSEDDQTTATWNNNKKFSYIPTNGFWDIKADNHTFKLITKLCSSLRSKVETMTNTELKLKTLNTHMTFSALNHFTTVQKWDQYTHLNHATEILHYVVESEQVDSNLANGRHSNYWRSSLFHESKQPFEHLSTIRFVAHVS